MPPAEAVPNPYQPSLMRIRDLLDETSDVRTLRLQFVDDNEAADAVANCGDRLATHNWRAASMGNRGGWQVVRCLFFLNVLTGSVATKGGTAGNGCDNSKL